jgi:hypothetical protein
MKQRAFTPAAALILLAAFSRTLTRAQPAGARESGHTPLDDIGSNFYLVFGPYDSGDDNGAVAQKMQWIRQAGVGVIVYSWWGQGSYENQHYAQTGTAAETAYLNRTAYWVNRFESLLGGGTDLAQGRPVTASGYTRQTITIQGSTDGTSYTTLVPSPGYTFNPSTGNTASMTFAATTVRYVKLTVTATTGWPAGQLSELGIYAS